LGAGYKRENLNIVDPITGRRIKTINAQQKKETGPVPLIYLEVTMVYHNIRGANDDKSEDKGKATLRKGIDVRGILYIQTLLNVFNSFWSKKSASSPINALPEIKTYKCIPISKAFGCTELLEPMVNIRNFVWTNLSQVPDDKKLKLLASLAAATTVSWILGFKDKLEDFLYIHDHQIVLYGLEKLHLWATKPFDAEFFQRLKPQLNFLTGNYNGWNVFHELCADTFKILHDKGSSIINMATTLYTGLFEKQVVEEFFTGNKGLMTSVNAQEALAHYSMALTGSIKAGFFKKLRIKT